MCQTDPLLLTLVQHLNCYRRSNLDDSQRQNIAKIPLNCSNVTTARPKICSDTIPSAQDTTRAVEKNEMTVAPSWKTELMSAGRQETGFLLMPDGLCHALHLPVIATATHHVSVCLSQGGATELHALTFLLFHSQLRPSRLSSSLWIQIFLFLHHSFFLSIVHRSLTYPLPHSYADGMTTVASPIPTSLFPSLSLLPAHPSLYSAELLTFCARFLQTTPSKCKLFLYISLQKTQTFPPMYLTFSPPLTQSM